MTFVDCLNHFSIGLKTLLTGEYKRKSCGPRCRISLAILAELFLSVPLNNKRVIPDVPRQIQAPEKRETPIRFGLFFDIPVYNGMLGVFLYGYAHLYPPAYRALSGGRILAVLVPVSDPNRRQGRKDHCLGRPVCDRYPASAPLGDKKTSRPILRC
jgi:hypothetical protein